MVFKFTDHKIFRNGRFDIQIQHEKKKKHFFLVIRLTFVHDVACTKRPAGHGSYSSDVP